VIYPVRAFNHQNEATAKSSANTATATAEYSTILGRLLGASLHDGVFLACPRARHPQATAVVRST
jgi:hypothetical protein